MSTSKPKNKASGLWVVIYYDKENKRNQFVTTSRRIESRVEELSDQGFIVKSVMAIKK